MGTANSSADTSSTDVLVVKHFGVKGMHWGSRKGSAPSSSASSGPRSEDSTRVHGHLATIERHGTQALSNKDLQEVVSRMNLLQQYGNLTGANSKHASSIDKGHDAVKKILAIHGTIGNVQKALNSPLTKSVKTAFKTAHFAQKAASSPGKHAAKFAAKQIMK